MNELQAERRDKAERQNIQRLQRKVDATIAELREAQRQRLNRIMED